MHREESKIIFESFKLYKTSSKSLNDLAFGLTIYFLISYFLVRIKKKILEEGYTLLPCLSDLCVGFCYGANK